MGHLSFHCALLIVSTFKISYSLFLLHAIYFLIDFHKLFIYAGYQPILYVISLFH